MLAMLAAGALALVGCAEQYPSQQVPVMPGGGDSVNFTQSPPAEAEYHIQPGDVLAIQSYYDSSLEQKVTVRPDGRISVIFLGDVVAAGKTPHDLSKELHDAYGEQLASRPDVVVTVADAGGQVVYIGGEVKAPTTEQIRGTLTLLQSVTAAGGFLPTANRAQVIILRAEGNGRFRAYQHNAELVLNNQSSEVFLKPHDIVYVPKTQIAQVDQFVDQYVNQIIPRAIGANFGYTFLDTVGGNPVIQLPK